MRWHVQGCSHRGVLAGYVDGNMEGQQQARARSVYCALVVSFARRSMDRSIL